MIRRSTIVFILLVAAAAWGVWYSLQPVRIGLIAELTGAYPAYGNSARKAASLLVKTINDKGGVQDGLLRRRIELIIRDNRADAAYTAGLVEALKRAGAVVIIGPSLSPYAVPAAEAASRLRIPIIIPWSSDPRLTQAYVYRITASDDRQGALLARLAHDNLHARRAAIVYDPQFPELVRQATGFRNAFPGSPPLVAVGDASVSAITQAQPDVLFIAAYYDRVPAIVREMRKAGVNAPLVGGIGWGSKTLFDLCGGDCSDNYVASRFSTASPLPEAAAFVRQYAQLYNSLPDDVAASVYDATGIAVAAIGREGGTAMGLNHTRNYKGVTGTISFESRGDTRKSMVISKTSDSDFTYYTTVSP